ncbi:hypothetical protein M9Y10_005589 [Tritrichomonas musculus]|uniref:Uncharacterized protein n=1 Tax=Tritrichomonas musculus TaxID=1915356 RepID=A0ABR2JCD9_9EUKA
MTLRGSYEQLKRKYAFNTGMLKERFLNVANTIFYNNNIYQKQYNLLLFRLQNPNLPIPNLLFSYSLDSTPLIDQDSATREFIDTYYKLGDNEDKADYSISKVLKEGFQFDEPASKLKLSPKIQLFSPDDRVTSDNRLNNPIVKSSELKTPFVIDYFCTSTFPSIFGHFTSNEYLLAGYNFIRRHIDDKLAPRLVGTYLLHTPLFKDRFFATFFEKVIDPLLKDSEDETNPSEPTDNEVFPDDQEDDMERIFKNKKYLSGDSLLKILYDAFASCINYFNEFHFKVVNLLREKDEQLAALSITLYFLSEVITVWKYSPIFNFTSIFNKIKSIRNPENFNEIFFHNILDDLIDKIINSNSFAIKILDLFRDRSSQYIEYPDISSMKYDGGFSFVVSIADMRIIYCITLAEKREKALASSSHAARRAKSLNVNKKFDVPVFTNVRDFLSEMFLLRFGYKQYITSSIKEPQSEIKSTELCEEKLKENEFFHNFLVERMKGMKLLQKCSDSSLNILKLKERQYSAFLWKNKNYSDEFRKSSLSSFCFSIFTGYVNYNQDHIKKLIEIGDQHFYQFFMSSFQNVYLKSSLVNFIFEKIANYYNVFRVNFEASGNGGNYEIHFSPDMIESSQFLVSEIERISFELLLTELNETPFQFIKDEPSIQTDCSFEDFRKNELDKYLKSNSIEIDPTIPESVSFYAEFIVEGLVTMNAIISLADDEMKNEIDKWINERFRIGDKLLLFLEIKDFIRKSLEKIDIDDTSDPNFLKYYLPAIIRNDSYDYDYFRANLINCIHVFKEIFNGKYYSFPTIGKEIIDDLDFLALIFDIKVKE